MKEIKDLKQVLLLLIANNPKPSWGYELVLKIKDRTNHNHQQVYRDLAALTKQNLLSQIRIEEVKGKPSRKLYSITQLGREALMECSYDFKTSTFNMVGGSYSVLLNDIQKNTEFHPLYIEQLESTEKAAFAMMLHSHEHGSEHFTNFVKHMEKAQQDYLSMMMGEASNDEQEVA